MYIVAQQVRGRNDAVGVNATRYEHVPGEVDWTRPDVLDFVTTQAPGRRVAQEFALTPGGNAVLSYADVVAAEPVLLLVRQFKVCHIRFLPLAASEGLQRFDSRRFDRVFANLWREACAQPFVVSRVQARLRQ